MWPLSGAEDGFVRKHYPIPTKAMSHEIYVHARDLLPKQFGNMFQLTDLWNSNIPTLEDYGQWLTKQMFMFNSDLLTGLKTSWTRRGRNSRIPICSGTSGKLGVRYIISDGTLNSPLVTEVMRETSPTETTILRLYEVQNANLGNLSPTKVVTAKVTMMPFGIYVNLGPDAAILLSPTSLPPDLVSARQSAFDRHERRISYHGCRAPEPRSWSCRCSSRIVGELVGEPESKAGLFRANIVQTGIYFQGKIDADLRFGFG